MRGMLKVNSPSWNYAFASVLTLGPVQGHKRILGRPRARRRPPEVRSPCETMPAVHFPMQLRIEHYSCKNVKYSKSRELVILVEQIFKSLDAVRTFCQLGSSPIASCASAKAPAASPARNLARLRFASICA